ncbi:MAG: histidine phosphatase family protein [Terriglobales bacterium]
MIYLIEHGETALDARGQSHGGRDEALNRKGRRQAVLLGQRLLRQRPHVAVIYHSPARRAAQTARIAGAVADIPPQVAPELAPLHSGLLGAGDERTVARRLQPYLDNPERVLPDGESVATWRERHASFMRRVLAQGTPAAMVTHSNVIGSVRGGTHGIRRAITRPPKSAEIAARAQA